MNSLVKSSLIYQKSLRLRTLFCQSVLKSRRNIVHSFNIPKQLPRNDRYHYLISLQINSFSSDATIIGELDYEIFCVETLDSLNDYFEELVESTSKLETADVLNKVRFNNCLFQNMKSIIR